MCESDVSVLLFDSSINHRHNDSGSATAAGNTEVEEGNNGGERVEYKVVERDRSGELMERDTKREEGRIIEQRNTDDEKERNEDGTADFIIVKKCRDFERILEWSLSNDRAIDLQND